MRPRLHSQPHRASHTRFTSFARTCGTACVRAARGEEKGVSGRRWSMTTTAWVDAGAAVQPLPARTQTAAVRTHGVLRRDAGARALRRSAAAALQRSVHACGTEVLFPMPTRRAGPLLARLPPPALRCETVLLQLYRPNNLGLGCKKTGKRRRLPGALERWSPRAQRQPRGHREHHGLAGGVRTSRAQSR